MSFNKPLDTITETDLQALVDNEVSEGKAIEYKQTVVKRQLEMPIMDVRAKLATETRSSQRFLKEFLRVLCGSVANI